MSPIIGVPDGTPPINGILPLINGIVSSIEIESSEPSVAIIGGLRNFPILSPERRQLAGHGTVSGGKNSSLDKPWLTVLRDRITIQVENREIVASLPLKISGHRKHSIVQMAAKHGSHYNDGADNISVGKRGPRGTCRPSDLGRASRFDKNRWTQSCNASKKI